MGNDEKILSVLEGLVVRFDKMETDMGEVKTDLAGVKSDLAGVKTELAEVKSELSEVKADLTAVKYRVALIENDHGKKLGVIMDDQAAMYDLLKETRADVAEIKEKQGEHEMRITILESRINRPA